jgi:hypothetical protein
MMGRISKVTAIFITVFFLCNVTNAQSNVVRAKVTDSVKKTPIVPKPKIKRPKPISTELSGGLRLNTDGWSIFVDRGKVRSEERESDFFYNLRYAMLEFSEKKHPKEKKTTSTGGGGGSEGSSSYIFGKVNNFYALKVGFGNRRMIAGKPDPGTVSIHWIYNAGLSIGMLKPYYIKSASGEEVKFTDSTRDQFLNGYNIVGSSGLMKGFNEIKIVPGLAVRTGLHFDFAQRERKKSKLAIETGISAEIYTKKIELMANQKAVPYFVNLYLSFQFGRRWE